MSHLSHTVSRQNLLLRDWTQSEVIIIKLMPKIAYNTKQLWAQEHEGQFIILPFASFSLISWLTEGRGHGSPIPLKLALGDTECHLCSREGPRACAWGWEILATYRLGFSPSWQISAGSRDPALVKTWVWDKFGQAMEKTSGQLQRDPGKLSGHSGGGRSFLPTLQTEERGWPQLRI